MKPAKPAAARAARTALPRAAWTQVPVDFPSHAVLASAMRIPVRLPLAPHAEAHRPQLFLHKAGAR
jgi:hypothetical protein